MLDPVTDFVDALEAFVRAQLRESAVPADYHNDSVQVVDARNHLFRNVGPRGTDEEQAIYPLRGLCHIDDETMELVPDRQRIAAVAREVGVS